MNTYAVIILILIFMYAFYMGFNDGSNAIATTVATYAIKPRTAIIVGSLSKFITPIAIFGIGLLSSEGSTYAVAENIRAKMLDSAVFSGISQWNAFVFLLAGMLGTMTWGLIAFFLNIPNSTSHTMLGGIIGSAIAAFGFGAIRWTEFVIVNVILMVILAPVIGLIFSYFLMKLTKRLARKASRGINNLLVIFQRLNLIILASAFSDNNSQKAIGLFMLMGALGLTAYTRTVPFWSVVLFAGALTLGMAFGGYRIVNVLGRKIYKIRDVHSVLAQMTTSIVMVAGTGLGLSLSTGQIMTSSIMGVGAAEHIKRVNWKTAWRIVVSWFLTLPLAASMGAVYYLIISLF